jgi:hypothetical protein
VVGARMEYNRLFADKDEYQLVKGCKRDAAL